MFTKGHFMKVFKPTQIGLGIVLIFQIAIFSGCDQYDELTNDPPKITSFTVPGEVAYGETVRLKARAFDPEDDTLTYVWDVSKGTLLVDTGPEVQWTAPELPPEEIVPPTTVTVSISVRDSGEEDVHKSASIIVFSKPYRIAQVLSGTYTLVSKRVHEELVEETGVLRLTISTFTREFQDSLEGETQGTIQYSSGTYKLVEPFDQSTGTIHWFVDGNPTPLRGTYTWDGRLLVLFMRSTATRYVYSIIGEDTSGIAVDDPKDIDPVPVNTDPVPVDDDIDPVPIEPVEEVDVDPEPANPGGKPIEITDQTFKTKVLDAKSPVVVEFRADWCPFCRQMKPIVDAVASEHRKTLIIGLLDIDANPQTTGEYKVDGIPTYIVFRDGASVARIVGAMPKTIFEQKIFDALK